MLYIFFGRDVSFDISNLYLPHADLSGDSYSSESELGVTVEENAETEPSRRENLSPEPRKKFSLIAKLALRSEQAALTPRNNVHTPRVDGALHGSLLAALHDDVSPVEASSTLEAIRPGTRYIGNSPELRSHVTLRSSTPRESDPLLEGPRYLEDLSVAGQAPITGVKRRRTLTTSNCGPDLALELDAAVWSAACLADSPPTTPSVSPVVPAVVPRKARRARRPAKRISPQ